MNALQKIAAAQMLAELEKVATLLNDAGVFRTVGDTSQAMALDFAAREKLAFLIKFAIKALA